MCKEIILKMIIVLSIIVCITYMSTKEVNASEDYVTYQEEITHDNCASLLRSLTQYAQALYLLQHVILDESEKIKHIITYNKAVHIFNMNCTPEFDHLKELGI